MQVDALTPLKGLQGIRESARCECFVSRTHGDTKNIFKNIFKKINLQAVFQCFEQSFKYLGAKTHRKYLEYLLNAAQVKVSMEAQAAQRGPKRNRGLLSCLECHRRKQKCDRLLPCRDCVQRGVPQKCNYKIPV